VSLQEMNRPSVLEYRWTAAHRQTHDKHFKKKLLNKIGREVYSFNFYVTKISTIWPTKVYEVGRKDLMVTKPLPVIVKHNKPVLKAFLH